MAVTWYREPAAPTIRGVLFDMDGLVLDTEKLYVRFWMEASREFGFPMTRQQALGMRSLNSAAGAARICSYFGPGADYQAIRARRIARMEAYIECHGVDPKPGIFQLLECLEARGIPAAITSSSPPERIRRYLSRHGLDSRFRVLCSGHSVANGKPAPDIYLYGAAALGFRPEECLALEDSPAGIEAAARAGCITVMVPDLDQPNTDTLQLLHAVADCLADVRELFP